VFVRQPTGEWKAQPLPREESGNRWSPGICAAPGPRILATCRHRTESPRGHPANCSIFENGIWSGEASIRGHKFETDPIAAGRDFMSAAGNSKDTIDFVRLHAKGDGTYEALIRRFEGPRGRIRGHVAANGNAVMLVWGGHARRHPPSIPAVARRPG